LITVKNKKRKKKHNPPLELVSPPNGNGRPSPRKRNSGIFFWGLGLGFLVTLGVIVSGDLGLNILPADMTSPNAGSPGSMDQNPAGDEMVFLAGIMPQGAHVYVDGEPVSVTSDERGVRVPLNHGARKIEVKGVEGTWWSTRLGEGGAADTLRPVLGGEIVVEVERQGPTGDLYLDGRHAGSVPGSLGDVDPGWHVISIRNGETILFEDVCEVRPGEVAVMVVPPVPPRGKGRLIVRGRLLGDDGFTEANGRPVWVDGVKTGVTPFQVTLDGGFHSVRVESETHPALVEVVHLEAGSARYVSAEFGREERLQIKVSPPIEADSQAPLAIPVHVYAEDESVLLEEGFLYVVRPGQAKPVGVPLVPSGTEPDLWVAVLPENLTMDARTMIGYASCQDDMGRSGDSEIFHLNLR
jgi:hypothetical protein